MYLAAIMALYNKEIVAYQLGPKKQWPYFLTLQYITEVEEMKKSYFIPVKNANTLW